MSESMEERIKKMRSALNDFVTAGYRLGETWVEEAVNHDAYEAVFKADFDECMMWIASLIVAPSHTVPIPAGEDLAAGDAVIYSDGELHRATGFPDGFDFIVQQNAKAGEIVFVPTAW